MSRLRRRLTFANVVSTLALFAALGGGALAASTIGAGGKIAACYRTGGRTKGLVRLVASGSRCKRGEKAIAWGLSGPKGAVGATGATGAAGTPGAKGDKGDTGAPGSTVVARLQGPQETLGAGLGDMNITFTPTTWSQAAGEDQLVLGVLNVSSISGCDGQHPLSVTLSVDGSPLGNTLSTGNTGARSFVAVPVPTLNPQAASSHTLTASAANTCSGSATFSLNVDVVSFK